MIERDITRTKETKEGKETERIIEREIPEKDLARKYLEAIIEVYRKTALMQEVKNQNRSPVIT